MDDTIGKRIQLLRIERSHTQVELAHRIGETLDTINKIETGKLEPNGTYSKKYKSILRLNFKICSKF